MKVQKITNVLAATDFSLIGNNAVMAAIAICKQQQAVLHLLHVVEKKINVISSLPAKHSALLNTDDQEARSQLYNMYERILKSHEIQVRIHMPTGVPADEISLAAQELPVDLVVIGAHGISGNNKNDMGSTALQVINKTNKSVLTIPAGYTPEANGHILFPIRPVKGVLEKFRFIQPLLTPQSQVHIALLYPGEGGHHHINYEQELAEILLNLRNLSVACTIDIYSTNNPAATVVELCAKLKAGIVVANAAISAYWARLMAAAYTRQLINLSPIPVLSFQNDSNQAASEPIPIVQNSGWRYKYD